MSRLTDKQRLFVEYYLQCFNAAAAARRAGYSGRTAHVIGAENLSKPIIQEAIKQRISEVAMSADEVLLRLGDQARARQTEFWEYDAYGQPRINFKELQESGLGHLVKELEFSEMTGRVTKLKFYDAQSALELIGKYHKLFTEKREVSGPDGGAIPIEDVGLDKRLARLRELVELGRARGVPGADSE